MSNGASQSPLIHKNGAILPKSISHQPSKANGPVFNGNNSFNGNTSNGFSVGSHKQYVGGIIPQNRDEMSSKESARRNSGFS